MYNYLASELFLRSNDLICGTHIYKCLKFLEKSQWFKPCELDEYQNQKLRAIISHSYHNVPYYHNLFKLINLRPEDIRTKEDLVKIPILTKEIIRKNKTAFIAKNMEQSNFMVESTSGSSGNPLEFIIDKDVSSIFRSLAIRSWEFAGYSLGDKLVILAGSSLLPSKMDLFKKLAFKANRMLAWSSYNIDGYKTRRCIESILEFKPMFIRGYPSSIALIAKKIIDSDIPIRVNAVMTTAEMLYKRDRELIEEAFNCDVFDQCGCNDGGEHLCECKEHSGYHVSIERSIHEFINDSNEVVTDNEEGHIILTDLCNFSMPLIRYDAGDIAIPSEELCACGRGLPLVKSLIGRSIEQILLPNGNLMPGIVLTDIFEKGGISNKILDYQIIQESFYEFTINIVKDQGYSESISSQISQFFEGHIGNSLNIQFNFVDYIPKTKANKRKIVTSKLSR